MKVVLYIRVSTQEQAKEGYSIGEQEERLRKYAELMGWTVVEVFVDGGYTGSNIYRPALQDMISFIKTQNIDKVLVYKLDRLSRSQRDTLFLIEDVFLKNNTDFISLNENFDTATPFGRAMIGILAVFAQLEREQIKERMAMGKEARAKEGYYAGSGLNIIGYNYIEGELIPNDYEAMLVNEIFNLFIKGTPIMTIVNKLNRKGLTHNRGKWNDHTISRLLQNRHYTGEVKYSGKWYQGKHTPLIEEDVFNKAQSIFKDREENYKRSNKTTSFLSGFLWCAECGARYHQHNGRLKPDNTRYSRYVCYSRSKRSPKMAKAEKCDNRVYAVKELEDIVFSEILKLDNTPEQIEENRKGNKNTENERKIGLIKKEIKDLSNQISNLMDLYSVSGLLDDVENKLKPLAIKRTNLINELETLTASKEEGLTNEEIFSMVEIFKKALDDNNVEEARFAISTLIKKIVIDEEDVNIHWNFA